jgi:hypothetical protein
MATRSSVRCRGSDFHRRLIQRSRAAASIVQPIFALCSVTGPRILRVLSQRFEDANYQFHARYLNRYLTIEWAKKWRWRQRKRFYLSATL